MELEHKIELGIIGGSGLYQMEGLDVIDTIFLATPFGTPSSDIVIGILEGLPVAFISRHGPGHILTPSEVNYQANIYALKALGVKKVVSVSACGSLREDYSPGNIVVPNQLFDFTKDRKRSFFGNKFVAHIGVAEPFCNEFSQEIFSAAETTGADVKRGGTAITIEGPRFSTRAESQIYRSWGLDLIGMTTSPEAFLAKEAELCYGVLFHVTDYDVWHQYEEPVSVEQIFEIIQQNITITQKSIREMAKNFNPKQDCDCTRALRHAFTTHPDAIPDEIYEKLALLVGKYNLKS